MEVFPGGCTSPGNSIGRLDCRDRSDFDQSYCPKSKGERFSIDECNSHCLEIATCAIYQWGGGVCWFYGQPDPDGSNGKEDQGWKCGVKKSPGCRVPSGITLTFIEEAFVTYNECFELNFIFLLSLLF